MQLDFFGHRASKRKLYFTPEKIRPFSCSKTLSEMHNAAKRLELWPFDFPIKSTFCWAMAQKPKRQLSWRASEPGPIRFRSGSQPASPSAALQHQRRRGNAATPRRRREQSFAPRTAEKTYVSVWVTPGWCLDRISKALLKWRRARDGSGEIESLGLCSWGCNVSRLRQFHTPNSTLSILSSELTSPLDLALAAWSCRHASLRAVTLLYFPRRTFSWALRCCYLSNPRISPRQRTSQINMRRANTGLLIFFAA